jgi:hypothetical protein
MKVSPPFPLSAVRRGGQGVRLRSYLIATAFLSEKYM